MTRRDQKHKADSVSLDDLADEGEKRKSLFATTRLASFKVLGALFIIFILVVSDLFTDNVVSTFKGAVEGRTPTNFGTSIQGVFVVIFYIVVLYLIEKGIF